MKPSKQLLEAIAVCAELTGTELSPAAAKVMADDLSRFPENQVMGALSRCRRELKGRMSLADVISRLDDGRPGIEEAWAMMPKDEECSVVWTDEMAQASAVSRPLLAAGDEVAARMAFKEVYSKLIQQARNDSQPVRWIPSLGYDKSGREGCLIEAARLGRLTHSHVQGLLPHLDVPMPAVAAQTLKLIK